MNFSALLVPKTLLKPIFCVLLRFYALMYPLEAIFVRKSFRNTETKVRKSLSVRSDIGDYYTFLWGAGTDIRGGGVNGDYSSTIDLLFSSSPQHHFGIAGLKDFAGAGEKLVHFFIKAPLIFLTP